MQVKLLRWNASSLRGKRTIPVQIRIVYLSPVSNSIPPSIAEPADQTGMLDVTLQQVRLLMAEEEKAKVEAGTSIMHDVSAGAFLLLGMDIQGLQ